MPSLGIVWFVEDKRREISVLFPLRVRDQLGCLWVLGPLNCEPCMCFCHPSMPHGLVHIHCEQNEVDARGLGTGCSWGWGQERKDESCSLHRANPRSSSCSGPSQAWYPELPQYLY